MIVLDCSAAVAIARGTAEGNALRSLFLVNERVISSQLFLIELASSFRKYIKAGMVDKALATRYLQKAVTLVDQFVPIEENYIEAFNESLKLNHSAYDLLYLTLARRNAATLVSLDTKLLQLCDQQGIDCVHDLPGF